jgi:cysteine dioxygenase
MKILKGRLRETLFTWPDQDLISHGQSSPPLKKKESLWEENEVSYISSKAIPEK